MLGVPAVQRSEPFGDDLVLAGDDHLAPVGFGAVAADEASMLETIDDTGDRSRGQPGEACELSTCRRIVSRWRRCSAS
jgi:hypothetical protein